VDIEYTQERVNTLSWLTINRLLVFHIIKDPIMTALHSQYYPTNNAKTDHHHRIYHVFLPTTARKLSHRFSINRPTTYPTI